MIPGAIGDARWWFTDRHGGTSTGPYASLNLALHVGDDPTRVAENRATLATRLGLGPPDTWQWLQQVHGATVVAARSNAGTPEADASVTTEVGLPVVVMTADCAPLVLVAGDGEALAVVHAGWGGLLKGVVGEAVAVLAARSAAPIRGVLGPCVHSANYPFGRDALAPLVARFGNTVAARTTTGDPALDVPAAVRIACAQAGVAEVEDVGICTYASPEHFSYRRDKVTGRQALVAVLT